jgi:hypothetical protein
MRRGWILAGGCFALGLCLGFFLQIVESRASADPVASRNGDVDGSGDIDISDPIYLLRYLFLGGPVPLPCPDALAGPVTTIVVVRHAEKESTGTDPGLTPEGLARAEHLAQLLRNTKIDLLLASDSRRTQETLAPVAALMPQVPFEKIAEAADVVTRLKALPQGSFAVVAHHSFTIHPILDGLEVAGTAAIDVSGLNFDNFIVVLIPTGSPPQFVPLTY